MWAFLQDVHEFKQGHFARSDWQSALLLEDDFTMPNGKLLAQLKALIQARDAAIRTELKDFVNGSRIRVDL